MSCQAAPLKGASCFWKKSAPVATVPREEVYKKGLILPNVQLIGA
jgi:hypothetical protein